MSAANPIRISVIVGVDTKSTKGLEDAIVASIGNASRRVSPAVGDLQKQIASALGPTAPIVMGFSGLSSIIGGIGRGLVGLSAGIYTVERLGAALGRVVEPLKFILASGDKALRYEQALSGIVGTMTRARLVNDAVFSASGNSQLPLDAIRQASLIFGRLSSVQPRLALQTPGAVSDQMQQMADLVLRYSLADPNKDIGSASTAIQTALSGRFRGLQSYGIDPHRLAASVGLTPTALAGDESRTVAALQAYGKQLIPNSAVEASSQLLGNQLTRLFDVIENGAERIGRSGLTASLANGIEHLSAELRDFVQTPEFNQRAESIAQSLSHILGNLGQAGLRFVRGLTGSSSDTQSVAGAVKLMDELGHSMDMWTRQLPQFAESLGSAIGKVVTALSGGAKGINAALGNAAAGPAGPVTTMVHANMPAVQTTLAAVRAGLVLNALNTAGVNAAGRVGGAALDAVPGSRGVLYDALGLGTNAMLHTFAPGLFYNHPAATNRPSATTQPFGLNALPADLLDALAHVPKEAIEGTWASGLFTPTQTALGRVAGGYATEPNQLAATINQAHGLIRDLFTEFKVNPQDTTEEPGSVLTKVGQQRDEMLGNIDGALSAATDAALFDILNGDLSRITKYRDEITTLTSARGAVESQYAQGRSDTLDILGKTGGRVGLAVSRLLGKESPEGQYYLLGKILSGTLTPQGDIANALRAAGVDVDPETLFRAGGQEEQANLLREYLKSGETTITAQAKYQGLGATATNQRLLEFLQEQQPRAAALLASAQGAYGESPTEVNGVALVNAQKQAGELAEKMRDLRLATDQTAKAWITFGDDVQRTLGDTIGDTLTKLEEGTLNLKDALKGFANEVLSDFNRLQAHALLNTIFQGAGGDNGKSGLGGLFGNLLGFGGGAGAGSSTPTGLNQAPIAESGGAPVASALGNIFGNGMLVPFAYGGVVTRPTTFGLADGRMGLAGERGYEGILPLARDPSGHLGVRAVGGHDAGHYEDNRTVNVNVSGVTDAGSFRKSTRQIQDSMKRALQ